MKSQSMILGSLLVSAVVLAFLLVVTPNTPKAQGEMTAFGADYQLIASASSVGGDESIHVIDNRDGRMMSYKFQITGPTAGTFKAYGYVNLSAKP